MERAWTAYLSNFHSFYLRPLPERLLAFGICIRADRSVEELGAPAAQFTVGCASDPLLPTKAN
jgi:hypothetical protein